jgi:hypothetical protein
MWVLLSHNSKRYEYAGPRCRDASVPRKWVVMIRRRSRSMIPEHPRRIADQGVQGSLRQTGKLEFMQSGCLWLVVFLGRGRRARDGEGWEKCDKSQNGPKMRSGC